MALILEIRDRRGTTTFHPLNGKPITLGRALSSDIILDDPYVDARHARIDSDDIGALTLRDLGSINGVLANGVRAPAIVPLQPGTELRIGRTTLRFRDRDEPVPPAIVDSSSRAHTLARWALTGRGSLLVMATLLGLTAINAWLGSTSRSKGSDVLVGVLAVSIALAIWSGIWAAVIRGPDRRFQARAHFAVAAAMMSVMMVYSILAEWLVFIFPDIMFVSIVSGAVGLLAVAMVVVGHLSVADGMTGHWRWRAGVSISGGLLLLTLIGAAVRDDTFSDVPRFPAQLKPIPPSLVPTRTVDQFIEAMAEAKRDADKAVKK